MHSLSADLCLRLAGDSPQKCLIFKAALWVKQLWVQNKSAARWQIE
jgi:hypothetical protein